MLNVRIGGLERGRLGAGFFHRGARFVLLVDLDLRRPSVHRYLGFSPEAGLTEVLTSDVELSDVLVNPGMDRLLVLPNRMSLSDSSEVLSSPKMVELVTQFKNLGPKWFVIYDMPPRNRRAHSRVREKH